MDNADLRKIKEICNLDGISTPGELLKNSKYFPDYILNSVTKCEELCIASEKRFAAINNTFANDVYYNRNQKGDQRLYGGSCTFVKRIEPYTTGESYVNAGRYYTPYVGDCPVGQMCRIEHLGKRTAHGNQNYNSYLYIKNLLDAGSNINDEIRYANWPSAQLVGHFHEDYYIPLCDSIDRLILELIEYSHNFSFKLFVNNYS